MAARSVRYWTTRERAEDAPLHTLDIRLDESSFVDRQDRVTKVGQSNPQSQANPDLSRVYGDLSSFETSLKSGIVLPPNCKVSLDNFSLRFDADSSSFKIAAGSTIGLEYVSESKIFSSTNAGADVIVEGARAYTADISSSTVETVDSRNWKFNNYTPGSFLPYFLPKQTNPLDFSDQYGTVYSTAERDWEHYNQPFYFNLSWGDQVPSMSGGSYGLEQLSVKLAAVNTIAYHPRIPYDSLSGSVLMYNIDPSLSEYCDTLPVARSNVEFKVFDTTSKDASAKLQYGKSRITAFSAPYNEMVMSSMTSDFVNARELPIIPDETSTGNVGQNLENSMMVKSGFFLSNSLSKIPESYNVTLPVNFSVQYPMRYEYSFLTNVNKKKFAHIDTLIYKAEDMVVDQATLNTNFAMFNYELRNAAMAGNTDWFSEDVAEYQLGVGAINAIPSTLTLDESTSCIWATDFLHTWVNSLETMPEVEKNSAMTSVKSFGSTRSDTIAWQWMMSDSKTGQAKHSYSIPVMLLGANFARRGLSSNPTNPYPLIMADMNVLFCNLFAMTTIQYELLELMLNGVDAYSWDDPGVRFDFLYSMALLHKPMIYATHPTPGGWDKTREYDIDLTRKDTQLSTLPFYIGGKTRLQAILGGSVSDLLKLALFSKFVRNNLCNAELAERTTRASFDDYQRALPFRTVYTVNIAKSSDYGAPVSGVVILPIKEVLDTTPVIWQKYAGVYIPASSIVPKPAKFLDSTTARVNSLGEDTRDFIASCTYRTHVEYGIIPTLVKRMHFKWYDYDAETGVKSKDVTLAPIYLSDSSADTLIKWQAAKEFLFGKYSESTVTDAMIPLAAEHLQNFAPRKVTCYVELGEETFLTKDQLVERVEGVLNACLDQIQKRYLAEWKNQIQRTYDYIAKPICKQFNSFDNPNEGALYTYYFIDQWPPINDVTIWEYLKDTDSMVAWENQPYKLAMVNPASSSDTSHNFGFEISHFLLPTLSKNPTTDEPFPDEHPNFTATLQTDEVLAAEVCMFANSPKFENPPFTLRDVDDFGMPFGGFNSVFRQRQSLGYVTNKPRATILQPVGLEENGDVYHDGFIEFDGGQRFDLTAADDLPTLQNSNITVQIDDDTGFMSIDLASSASVRNSTMIKKFDTVKPRSAGLYTDELHDMSETELIPVSHLTIGKVAVDEPKHLTKFTHLNPNEIYQTKESAFNTDTPVLFDADAGISALPVNSMSWFSDIQNLFTHSSESSPDTKCRLGISPDASMQHTIHLYNDVRDDGSLEKFTELYRAELELTGRNGSLESQDLQRLMQETEFMVSLTRKHADEGKHAVSTKFELSEFPLADANELNETGKINAMKLSVSTKSTQSDTTGVTVTSLNSFGNLISSSDFDSWEEHSRQNQKFKVTKGLISSVSDAIGTNQNLVRHLRVSIEQGSLMVTNSIDSSGDPNHKSIRFRVWTVDHELDQETELFVSDVTVVDSSLFELWVDVIIDRPNLSASQITTPYGTLGSDPNALYLLSKQFLRQIKICSKDMAKSLPETTLSVSKLSVAYLDEYREAMLPLDGTSGRPIVAPTGLSSTWTHSESSNHFYYELPEGANRADPEGQIKYFWPLYSNAVPNVETFDLGDNVSHTFNMRWYKGDVIVNVFTNYTQGDNWFDTRKDYILLHDDLIALGAYGKRLVLTTNGTSQIFEDDVMVVQIPLVSTVGFDLPSEEVQLVTLSSNSVEVNGVSQALFSFKIENMLMSSLIFSLKLISELLAPTVETVEGTAANDTDTGYVMADLTCRYNEIQPLIVDTSYLKVGDTAVIELTSDKFGRFCQPYSDMYALNTFQKSVVSLPIKFSSSHGIQTKLVYPYGEERNVYPWIFSNAKPNLMHETLAIINNGLPRGMSQIIPSSTFASVSDDIQVDLCMSPAIMKSRHTWWNETPSVTNWTTDANTRFKVYFTFTKQDKMENNVYVMFPWHTSDDVTYTSQEIRSIPLSNLTNYQNATGNIVFDAICKAVHPAPSMYSSSTYRAYTTLNLKNDVTNLKKSWKVASLPYTITSSYGTKVADDHVLGAPVGGKIILNSTLKYVMSGMSITPGLGNPIDSLVESLGLGETYRLEIASSISAGGSITAYKTPEILKSTVTDFNMVSLQCSSLPITTFNAAGIRQPTIPLALEEEIDTDGMLKALKNKAPRNKYRLNNGSDLVLKEVNFKLVYPDGSQFKKPAGLSSLSMILTIWPPSSKNQQRQDSGGAIDAAGGRYDQPMVGRFQKY